MIPEPDEELKQTLREKVLFHVTAFFVLVGIFSLFAFLFLVPFVVDPALSTITAAFDPTPADCVTISVMHNKGNSNCSWASCREGCTREVYLCTQLRVFYRRLWTPGERIIYEEEEEEREENLERREEDEGGDEYDESYERKRRKRQLELGPESWDDYEKLRRTPRAVHQEIPSGKYVQDPHPVFMENGSVSWVDGQNMTIGYVYYTDARVFPNVKGCGYPPVLNCSIWHSKHSFVGSVYPCYFSRIDPGMVITQLDMHAVYMDLVYAVLIPVPSFIISVVYLAFAYFKIYNEDEEATPEEGVGVEGEEEGAEGKEGSEVDGEGKEEEGKEAIAKSPTGSEGGVDAGVAKGATEGGVGNGVAGGGSLSGGKAGSPTSGEAVIGNLTKTMTTSITPPPGPIAEV